MERTAMRLLEIESLELIGGDRRIEFEAGLNIVLGPMASGKTTIVNLLLRFYDPQRGRILVDGIDIRNIPAERLRSLEQAGVRRVMCQHLTAEDTEFVALLGERLAPLVAS